MARLLCLLTLVLFLGIPGMTASDEGIFVLFAEGPCKIFDASGKLGAQGEGESLEGKEVPLGGKFETGEKASAVLIHAPDMTRVTVNEKSSFQVKTENSLWLTLGKIWVKISKPFMQRSNFEVRSPNAVAIAHGTQFDMSETGESAEVHVFEGNVEFQSEGGNQVLGPGKAGAALRERLANGGFRRLARFRDFNVKTPDSWQQWNLKREGEMENLLQRHGPEIRRVLAQHRLRRMERIRRFRNFLRARGMTREKMRPFFRQMRNHPRFERRERRLERRRERRLERRP